MTADKPLTFKIEKLAQISGLQLQEFKELIQSAGITIGADDSLSKEDKDKVLDTIRQRRQSKKQSIPKLSLGKKPLSLNRSSHATETPAPEAHQIISLDKKFREKQQSQSSVTEPPLATATTTKTQTPESKKKKSPAPEKTAEGLLLTVEEVLNARKKSQSSPDTPSVQANTKAKQKGTPTESHIIEIPSSTSVQTLAEKTKLKSTDFIKAFFDMGEMVTENQELSFEMAELILGELGYKAQLKEDQAKTKVKQTSKKSKNTSTELALRPPIVTIMGHVDHGKTSLLDKIRQSNHVSSEAGGITQHIGAWQVNTDHGKITFLDTPGHESFSAMRSRGTQVTDIVILVVAANDGVMPQTKEAIQHAKSADVPMVVAINKVDREDADLDRVRNELSQEGILSEDWGGDTIFQEVSAKTGQGIQSLLENIALQAEILDLKADYADDPTGVVIESRLDKGKGPVCTVIVKSGVFKPGLSIYVNEYSGKVRNMTNSDGQTIKVANPSEPFELIGLSGTPKPGDTVETAISDKEAKAIALKHHEENRKQQMRRKQALKTEHFLKKMQSGQEKPVTVLSIILKADVDGSLEAITDYINQNNSEDKETPFTIDIVGTGVGGINTSDVQLALASESIVIGFNVRPDASAKNLITQHQVKINYFSIIYELIDYLNLLEKDMTEPETTEEIVGEATVKDVFRSSKFGTIAGCLVNDGIIKKNALARVLRNNTVIFSGKIESLRRFQDNVNEVKSSLECGIGIKAYSDIKAGDVIETYIIKERKSLLPS